MHRLWLHLLLNIPWGKEVHTSPADGVPQGDTFDIDFVVHEIGHQLGANHTFHMSLENPECRTRKWFNNYGYAGITTIYDVQASSDDYFAYVVSILQIQNLPRKPVLLRR
jgi:hypothetical protein